MLLMVQLHGAILICAHFKVNVIKLFVDQADCVDLFGCLGGDKYQVSRIELNGVQWMLTDLHLEDQVKTIIYIIGE